MGLIKWLFGSEERKRIEVKPTLQEVLNKRNPERQRWSVGGLNDWHCCICGVRINKPDGSRYCLCGGCSKHFKRTQANGDLTIIDGLDEIELFWLWRNQQCIAMDCFVDHLISEETAQTELKEILAEAKQIVALRRQTQERERIQMQKAKLEQQQFRQLDNIINRLS